MKKIFKIAAIVIGGALLLVALGGIYVKTALPDVGPAPDLVIAHTPERILRGSYLANHVTVCIDCHSTRDWASFSGPISGGIGAGGERFGPELGFPGTFFAKNITPEALAGWTDGEIFRAITTGVNRDGVALFPLMPYHAYGAMDEEDIYSVIAYIRTLTPIANEIPPSAPDFPISFLINTMPRKANFQPRPDTSDALGYGKYLVNAAACIDCHTQVDKGALIAGTEFGGGREFLSPGGVVTSSNITPHGQTGIGAWSSEAFVRRFKSYADSTQAVHALAEGDLNTPMPWTMYAGMSDADLHAIYTYLMTIAPIDNRVDPFRKY